MEKESKPKKSSKASEKSNVAKAKKTNSNKKTKKGLYSQDTVVTRSEKFRISQKKKEKKSLKEILSKIDRRVWTFIFGLVLILIVILALSNFTKWLDIRKYKKYEEKMDLYQFTELYNNKKCKSNQKVTKAEAIKFAIATVFNTDNLVGYAKEYDDYENQTWVEYAKYFKLIGEDDITINNYNDQATYFDAVMYFENAKRVFTDIELNTTDEEVLKNQQLYSKEEQIAFLDMVGSGIISVKTKNIDPKDEMLNKAKLNELVVNFLEQYALISVDSSRLRFTDLPKNAGEYPYILFDVPNEVYEYERYDGTPILDTMDSKLLYKYKKKLYSQVKNYVEKYYEAMLNVDYENINFISYSDNMNKYLVYTSRDVTTYEYVEYVKNNHIKLKADVKFMEPCLYFDGSSYRARIRINLKILSADTRDNLLLYDTYYGDSYTYNKDSYTIYLDASLTNVINSNLLFLESGVVIGQNTLNSEYLDITCTKGENATKEVQE